MDRTDARIIPGLLAENDHIKWADTSKRGWVEHIVTSDEWRADYLHVDDATVPGSPVSTATSWMVAPEANSRRCERDGAQCASARPGRGHMNEASCPVPDIVT